MVTCCGLRYPAWMSQARVCETPAGETGKARLKGSRACCMRSRMTGLAWALGRCQPISRKRDPRTEDGATEAAPKAKTTTTMVRKTKMESARVMDWTLLQSLVAGRWSSLVGKTSERLTTNDSELLTTNDERPIHQT